jgi:Peptidase M15
MKLVFVPWIIATAEPNLAVSELGAGSVAPIAGVAMTVNGTHSTLPVISASSMPGEAVALKIPEGAKIDLSAGRLDRDGDTLRWTAPKSPGLAEMMVSHRGAETRLNLLVLTPFENGVDDSLNGYRIGMYARPLRDLPSYAVPRGFIDLNAMPEDLQVSPNFQLGQFRCKQQPGHEPTYLLMQPDMLVKLETILAAANEKGWEADTFFVMSGYRTPFYNAAIGNTTTSSRHLYGDAADIYIDQDRDGQMDDLDRNGRIDKEDARALVKLIDELAAEQPEGWVMGGASAYGSNAAHGPFVHIDTRGYSARW